MSPLFTLPFSKGELEGIFTAFNIFKACKIPLNPPLKKGDSKKSFFLTLPFSKGGNSNPPLF